MFCPSVRQVHYEKQTRRDQSERKIDIFSSKIMFQLYLDSNVYRENSNFFKENNKNDAREWITSFRFSERLGRLSIETNSIASLSFDEFNSLLNINSSFFEKISSVDESVSLSMINLTAIELLVYVCHRSNAVRFVFENPSSTAKFRRVAWKYVHSNEYTTFGCSISMEQTTLLLNRY